jgi:hypothetical protein
MRFILTLESCEIFFLYLNHKQQNCTVWPALDMLGSSHVAQSVWYIRALVFIAS